MKPLKTTRFRHPGPTRSEEALCVWSSTLLARRINQHKSSWVATHQCIPSMKHQPANLKRSWNLDVVRCWCFYCFLLLLLLYWCFLCTGVLFNAVPAPWCSYCHLSCACTSCLSYPRIPVPIKPCCPTIKHITPNDTKQAHSLLP